MKTNKTIISLLCTAALLLSLSGCASLSGYFAESKEAVLLRLTQYVDGRTPTTATAAIDFAMASELDGSPAEITVSVKNRTMIALETDAYSEGEFSYTINDQQVHDSAQVYNFAEDGKLLTFTHVDSTDRWMRSEAALPEQLPVATPAPTSTPVPAEDSAAEVEEPTVTIPEQYEFLLLEEGTQTLDGQEVYVLTGAADGETFAELLHSSTLLHALTARLQSAAPKGTDTSAIDLSALDFASLTADVIVSVNKQTCAPVQLELTVSGLNLLITDVMDMLPEQSAALLGSSVTIEPVRVVLSDISFEPVTIPEVTEEMRLKALLGSFEPDQGDGTYVLHQYTDAVKITAQSKWSTVQLSQSRVAFHNPDKSRSAFYELYENTTGEAFIELVESGMIPAMEAQELVVTTAAGEAIGDYQTYSICANGMNVYLAYRTVGDSLLGIYAEDSTGANMTSVLTSILEAVEDYQLTY